ncbi:MAG: VanZ family protein [Ornithinimicrobium sp.]
MPSTDAPDAPVWARRVGYLALVALAGFQVWALYLTVPEGGPDLLHGDKLVHAAMFAAPAALAILLRMRWVVVLLVVHALASEPLQAALTRSREADLWDTVADVVGIVIGVAAAGRVRGRDNRQLTGARR